MKTVYFVRHGESTANVGHPRYLPEGEVILTDKGHEQAKFIAERAKKLSIEALLASTVTRAVQTAEHIEKETGLKMEKNELFVERIPPSSLFGRPTDDPEAQAIEEKWMQTFLRDNAKLDDGENFQEIKTRAINALKYLERRPEEKILVVTHGFFLHMVSALVLLGESLSAAEFNRTAPAIWVDNTGLTRIEHRDQVFARIDGKRHKGWVLRVWNDHAHLG